MLSCPDGGKIIEHGISHVGVREVVRLHNKFRMEVAHGSVKNQPRGINLKRMKYDHQLDDLVKTSLENCKLQSKKIHDERFRHVGQNLFMEMTTDLDSAFEQNWEKVITSWFNDNENYQYPNLDPETMAGGHYSQIVWAESEALACHFIAFENLSNTRYPYGKIYTCYYGPGGNIIGKAPYKSGRRGCENLC
ncbi:PREDICTED: cysteine-rich secretory protein 2-like [Nicrophorus vespilloides]|uniref:Cysteine-rich secretory protein 2-like n=1 Tax=Nicrophorus vespilloides TaxID=110193 RepID=A0ABM1NA34_NICVS|nr:PREDICTED: cysteine-rich secretory protein 2-like [Nicrophorus vespilloides]